MRISTSFSNSSNPTFTHRHSNSLSHISTQPHDKQNIMATFTRMQYAKAKILTSYSVPKQQTSQQTCMSQLMLNCLMEHTQGAIKVGSANLNMAYEMRSTIKYSIFELKYKCSQRDVPSLMHAIQMDAHMHSIRYAKLNVP